MGILKLKPAYKHSIWGGSALCQGYHKRARIPLAECWELSVHPHGHSCIDGGPFDGMTLQAYINQQGLSILGSKGKSYEKFPILVKLIDANQPLSIQVHPDDDYALVHEHTWGKDEMWVILEAKPEAVIFYGPKQELSRDCCDLSEDMFHKVTVKKGDVIVVKAKTIHAIGAGIVLCEIQQNSDITYRLFDYNRGDKFGVKRSLQLEQGLTVACLSPQPCDTKPCGRLMSYPGYTLQCLAMTAYFTTYRMCVQGDMTFDVDDTSFEGLVVIAGDGVLGYKQQEMSIRKGTTVFIEANTKAICIRGVVECLRVRCGNCALLTAG